MRRASVYTTLEQHDKAVYDYEKCKQLDPSNRELAGLLRQAKLELKVSSRKPRVMCRVPTGGGRVYETID